MKILARNIFILLFSSLSLISHDKLSYLTTCSEHDLQLVANVAYFSGKRSQATLRVHKAWRHDQEIMRKISENIENTRRNPSKKMPHVLSIDEMLQARIVCSQEFENYRSSGAAYKYCVNTLLVDAKDLFDAQKTRTLIEELRADARYYVATEFAKELNNIKELLTTAYNAWNKQIPEDLHSFNEWYDTIARSLLETIAEYVPTMSMQALVYFDREVIDISKKSWTLLLQNTDIGIYLWDIIERARLHYYRELYAKIIAIAKERCVEHTVLLAVFDENGFIPAENRSIALPEAHTLWIF